jgi:CheY-like chemotaxis protein
MSIEATSDRAALVIDDTPANRDFLERLLAQAGYRILGASSGAAGMERVKDLDHLALALVDMQLPDTNGLQLTYDLRRRYPDVYIIVATMYDERSLMESVFHKGGNVFLVKPHGFMELYKRLITPNGITLDDRLIIDQYGPRPYNLART